VSVLPPEELEELRADGLSPERRREFEAAALAARRFEQARPGGIEEILHWIDELRALFGDPPIDRRPWQGDDFRL
jgi:hypothetical protein